MVPMVVRVLFRIWGLLLDTRFCEMKRFLNLGSGAAHIRQAGVEWVNIDKEPSHEPDICGDYLDLLSVFNDVDGIITIHSIEHLAWPGDVARFFREAYISLSRGSTMRIVVPDLMKVAKLYVAGDDLKGIYGPDFKIDGPDCAATRFMCFCRAWEHTVLFDERLLRMLMEQAGFVDIREMPFGVSGIAELNGLDRMPAESISVECQKP